MSLKIRLARAGTKKRPFYRIVVADSHSPRDGRYIEKLGTYDPLLPKGSAERIKFSEDRVKHWLGVGAQPTDRVLRFLDTAGIKKREARAKRNRPEFELNEANLSAVLKICQLVEGLPLGLELAASWTKVISASENMALSLDY